MSWLGTPRIVHASGLTHGLHHPDRLPALCRRRPGQPEGWCRHHRAGSGRRGSARRPDPALGQRPSRRPDQPHQAAKAAKLRPGQLRPAATARSEGGMIHAKCGRATKAGQSQPRRKADPCILPGLSWNSAVRRTWFRRLVSPNVLRLELAPSLLGTVWGLMPYWGAMVRDDACAACSSARTRGAVRAEAAKVARASPVKGRRRGRRRGCRGNRLP